MICQYSNEIALQCRINAALIAGYIWQEQKTDGTLKDKKRWVRAGRKKLMAAFPFPFMCKCTVGNAMNKLVDAGVILRREINNCSFDRTLSAAFTTYGISLMESGEQNE